MPLGDIRQAHRCAWGYQVSVDQHGLRSGFRCERPTRLKRSSRWIRLRRRRATSVSQHTVVSGSLCAEACRPAAPRPDARKNAPPAMDLRCPLRLGWLRAPVRNQLGNRVLRASVANRCLRGRQRLRCIFRTDAARWPHRATGRHAPAQSRPANEIAFKSAPKTCHIARNRCLGSWELEFGN